MSAGWCRAMKRTGTEHPAIVLISSVAGIRGMPVDPPYAVSKAGVIGAPIPCSGNCLAPWFFLPAAFTTRPGPGGLPAYVFCVVKWQEDEFPCSRVNHRSRPHLRHATLQ